MDRFAGKALSIRTIIRPSEFLDIFMMSHQACDVTVIFSIGVFSDPKFILGSPHNCFGETVKEIQSIST